MKFFITFRDTTNRFDHFSLKFNIKQTVLAKNWTDMLISNLINNTHPIEKTYCLHGWQNNWESSYSRNLGVLCEKLNHSIQIINQNMGPLGYPKIDLDFNVDKLKSKDYQNLMNELHHHFELLIGQIWDVSEWYQKAPNELTRTAIRMLNNYCHEIEGSVRTIKDRSSSCAIYISCNGVNNQNKYYLNKTVRYLTLEEFECFQDYTNWGDVKLFYAQLGKTHLDVYYEQDVHIDRTNISSYQTMTGESVIAFQPDNIISENFKVWCKNHDFDFNDKSLGIGFPVVASVENPFTSQSELTNKIRNYDDLYQIGIEDDQGAVIAIKTYDYTWHEEEVWKWASL